MAQEKPSGTLTAAILAPLFFGVATSAQAERVAQVVRARLLKPGGLATTTVSTGQQDAPNAWAPLQWIAIEGLSDYGETGLAETIAERWMRKVITAYRATGKLMEKYNAEDPSSDRRWRIPDARWLWLDQRGVAQAPGALPERGRPRAPVRAGVRPRRPTTTCRQEAGRAPAIAR